MVRRSDLSLSIKSNMPNNIFLQQKPIQQNLAMETQPVERFFAETNKEMIQFAGRQDTVMLGLIAPVSPERLSPIHFGYAHIDVFEELVVENFVDAVSQLKPKPNKLFLLLNSPGGTLLSSYKIAKALREFFDNITVFVPNIAASGGTLVALIGNKIVMGPMSSLSPLDPQLFIGGKRRYSALTPLKALDRWNQAFAKLTAEEAPYPKKALVDKLDPLLIEECTAIANAAVGYAQEVLLLTGYSQSQANKIANNLVWNAPIHDYHLGIKEAKLIGLKVESCDRCRQMWGVMRKWLYTHIVKKSATHLIPFIVPRKTKTKEKTSHKNRGKTKKKLVKK